MEHWLREAAMRILGYEFTQKGRKEWKDHGKGCQIGGALWIHQDSRDS